MKYFDNVPLGISVKVTIQSSVVEGIVEKLNLDLSDPRLVIYQNRFCGAYDGKYGYKYGWICCSSASLSDIIILNSEDYDIY